MVLRRCCSLLRDDAQAQDAMQDGRASESAEETTPIETAHPFAILRHFPP